MITGLIDMRWSADPDRIDALTDTLACLVAGVAAGLVGDAVIIARLPDDTLAAIAEGAGASFVVLAKGESPWQAGARLARREWLLCLDAGDVPREGWIRALDRFTGSAAPTTLLGRMRRSNSWLGLRIRDWAEMIFGTATIRAGDVVRRDHLLDADQSHRRLKPRALIARLDRV